MRTNFRQLIFKTGKSINVLNKIIRHEEKSENHDHYHFESNFKFITLHNFIYKADIKLRCELDRIVTEIEDEEIKELIQNFRNLLQVILNI